MAGVALYQNRPFWIGCADIETGKIEETHTYEEAERADFHTCFYFSEKQEARSRQGDNIYFWIEEDGTIQFDANGLGPERAEELICRIEDQLVFPKERQGDFEKGNDPPTMLQGSTAERNIFILYGCNEWKEFSSMKALGVTSSQEVLYAMIGAKIKSGDMLYRSDEKEQSWELYQEDYQKGQIRLEDVTYGFVEQHTDLYFTEPELSVEFPEVVSVWEALQGKRLEEIVRPLYLDRQSLIFSEVHMTSSLGYERLFLPGYGREDVLKESPVYQRLAREESDGNIHVDISTYVMGNGEQKEADWAQARLIEENFVDLIGLYQTYLCSSDCYDICAEWDMEP